MPDILRPRRGTTIPELLISLVTLGLLCSIAIPRVGTQLDRLAARGAARDVRTMLTVARARAIGGGRPTTVVFGSADSTAGILRGTDTLQWRPLGQVYGVSVKATRPSTSFGVNGLGIARANLRIVFRRRTVQETVFVSREGRVR